MIKFLFLLEIWLSKVHIKNCDFLWEEQLFYQLRTKDWREAGWFYWNSGFGKVLIFQKCFLILFSCFCKDITAACLL